MQTVQNRDISDRLNSIILLVIAATLWSLGGLFIKWIEWDPLAIAGARSIFAAITIGLIFRQSISKSIFTWNRAQVIGGVAYAAAMITFVAATKMTTAANAILLQYTSPVYVAILGAIFLQERPQLFDWITIAFVGGGMVLFFQDQVSLSGLQGNILAIICGVCMAVNIVVLRWQKEGSTFQSVFLGNILTFLCGLPFMFEGSPGMTSWIILIGLGCLQLGLPWVLYTMAIKHVTAFEASIITIIEPLLNPVWVFLFLGEAPGPWAMVGGLVIVSVITARYVLPAIQNQSVAANK